MRRNRRTVEENSPKNICTKRGRMTTISDLSEDLVVEIFSRVPFTSLSSVRSTYTRWNDITKCQILGKKAARKNQFQEFMIIDSKVCSLRLDLQGIHNEDEDEDFADPSMKQIRIPKKKKLEISQVYHCDGLLLCVARNSSRLVVWNPYLVQTKRIRPRTKLRTSDLFAFGYEDSDKKNRNHKILRFYDDYENGEGCGGSNMDVYDFRSDSWKVLNVNPDWDTPIFNTGVSLKGNAYFFGQELTTEKTATANTELLTETKDYLLCFDFTRECFGPRLPLPFNPPSPIFEYLTLSWVRDDKLAVLYNHYETIEIIEIWISTRIDPNAVSWSVFLKLDMTLINDLPDGFSKCFQAWSFFIDEESKVAVLFDLDTYKTTETSRYQMAFIFGDDGYFRSVNLGVNPQHEPGKLVCSSYVPSLVQLQV